MSVARLIYCGMLVLYPREFRVRFAPELLQTFDSTVAEYGAARLMVDLACSLQRQWLICGLRRKHRPALVLGSIIQGEYPGFDLDRPDAARMLQGAVVCGLVLAAAVCLNQVRTGWSLVSGGVTRVELPYSYSNSELARGAVTRPGNKAAGVRHAAVTSHGGR